MSIATTFVSPSLDLAGRYRAIRRRTKTIFGIVKEEAYYEQPILLRNPIVFYEGHLPAFAVNTLLKLGLNRRGIDDALEVLFARGIDPGVDSRSRVANRWPKRSDVQRYAETAETFVAEALENDAASVSDLAREAAHNILEHELMHQETLLYMFHQLPYEKKRKIPALNSQRSGAYGAPASAGAFDVLEIPRGVVTLGAERNEIPFGWDNEFPTQRVPVETFTIDRFPVTNGQYLEFVEATAAVAPMFWLKQGNEWFWRGMFELTPLLLDAPVYVSKDQADSYARWRGKRLPTEAEYHRAAFGTPSGEERIHPWGDAIPSAPEHGNFDFMTWDPVPNGSHPAGASAWGVEDLVGNGWEWTSTLFAGFPGFRAMPTYPQYSADFFDGDHFVLKGASPATGRELIRRSFRNWFRPKYPFVYAKFRCVA